MSLDSVSLDRHILFRAPSPESLEDDIVRASHESFGAAATKQHISITFGVPENLIRKTDEQTYKLFALKAGTAFLRAMLFGARSLDHGKTVKSKRQAQDELRNYVKRKMAYHDLAHLIWKSISSGGKTSVPAFLTEESQPLNEKLVREEIGAGLFTNIYPEPELKTINTLVALTLPEETEKLRSIVRYNIIGARAALSLGHSATPALDYEELNHAERMLEILSLVTHDSFESVYDVFQKIHSAAVKMEMIRNSYVPKRHWESFSNKHDVLTSRVITEPEPLCRELAFRIFSEHKSNPRVVLDIFLEHCSSPE